MFYISLNLTAPDPVRYLRILVTTRVSRVAAVEFSPVFQGRVIRKVGSPRRVSDD